MPVWACHPASLARSAVFSLCAPTAQRYIDYLTPRTLFVTNDYPPKTGGIQVVEDELYSRLDPSKLHVLAAAHADAPAFDARRPETIERIRQKTMLPTPGLARRLERLIDRFEPDVVAFGSALPLSLLGSVCIDRSVPYVTMTHGAEISMPASLPISKSLIRRALGGASGIVALGPWVAEWSQRAVAPDPAPPIIDIYPGVDTEFFCPGDRARARVALGLNPDRPTITSMSRLVPRKGMHLLIEASKIVRAFVPDVQVAIGGTGRERHRLDKLIADAGLGGTVKMLGRIPDENLADIYRAADVSTMLCHPRWRGLEQEGFGIVFIEASACGIPVVAGRSGGATDAVQDGVTGTIVDARDRHAVAAALVEFLQNPSLRDRVGAAGRSRAVDSFRWPLQARRFTEWMTEQFARRS